MVFLGFGKYVRADRIYALEPIVGDERGNGRRTLVWVEGMAAAMVASRTQETILEEMGADSSAAQAKPSRRAAAGAPEAVSRWNLTPPTLDPAGAARGRRSRRRARPARLDVPAAGSRRSYRRGRGIHVRRPGEPCLSWPHPTERLDVRGSGNAVRLPLVRHSLVRERRRRAARVGRSGARSGPRAHARGRRDVRPPGDDRSALPVRRPGKAHAGSRDHRRRRRRVDRRAAVRARAADRRASESPSRRESGSPRRPICPGATSRPERRGRRDERSQRPTIKVTLRPRPAATPGSGFCSSTDPDAPFS